MGIDEELQTYLRDMFEQAINQGLRRIRGVPEGGLELPGHVQRSSTTTSAFD